MEPGSKGGAEHQQRRFKRRLQRTERVFSEAQLTTWEMFVRDSLLTIAWPELITTTLPSSHR